MPIDFFRGLNDRQIEAIKINNKPLLILAGAGSGKTRVLTHKIAYLILHEKYPAYSILAMTFTNKAALEMKNRISKMLGSDISSLWIGTFHSLFARLLRRHGQLIGYTSNFTIFDRDDSLNVVKEVLKKLPDGVNINPRNILGQISNAKNAMVTPDEAANLEHYDNHFIKAYNLYEVELEKSNSMDFDDLLIKPLQLFDSHPEIKTKYQKYFHFILIDEYQDTNVVQFKLAKTLADQHQRICVVGDEDQSIYGWRGANIGNILTFAESFPGAKTVRLEQNYRSFSAILEVANSVVKRNKNRLGKNLFTDKGIGEKPIIWECETGRKEANKTFQIVSDVIKKGKYKLGEIAVLYRTNAHSRLLEEVMRNQGISYDIVGGTKFYDRMEIKDAIAYLRMIVNPFDSQAFKRMIAVPKRGVGAKTLEQIVSFSEKNEVSLLDSLKSLIHEKKFSEKTQNKLGNLVDLLGTVADLNGKTSMPSLVEKIISESGLINHYESVDEKEKSKYFSQPDSINSRVDNLFDLVDTVNEYSKRQVEEITRIDGFLQEIQLQSDIDEWNESPQKLTLMTIHQSKGLEFPVIIISGLEQGLLPLSHNFELPEDLEEERRLFYVAVTRAEDVLYMTYAKRRFRHGDEMYCIPSQFIDEIHPDLVTFHKENREINSFTRRINEQKGKIEDDEPYYDYSDTQMDNSEALSIGLEVNHPTFGDGKIINIEGFGGNTKITVLFYDGYFSKKLLRKYAKLQVIDS